MTDEKTLKREVTDKLIERLEIYRLENRISQQKLAKILEVSFPTVSKWIRKKHRPNKIQTYHINKLLEGVR